MTKPNHYVNNKDLYAAMVEYKNALRRAEENGEEKPRIPEYVGECIQLIAKRTASRSNFAGYSYREEMVSDGILNCVLYIDNWDPEKGKNPFGYFGKIIWWAFVRRIGREKDQSYIKIKNMEMNFVESAIEHGSDGHHVGDGQGGNWDFYDNEITSEFVKNYEEKAEKKKSSRKKKGLSSLVDSSDEKE